MIGHSRSIRSAQRSIHADLHRQVITHLAAPWRRPIAQHTRQAFRSIAPRVDAHAGPLLIDAGCGTGLSTRSLAKASPGTLALGVDKSLARLGATAPMDAGADATGETRLLRADLRDFWRLALAAGWQPERQCILYPNPWPKPGQLGRRWQAHPVLPYLVALGGELELRSNWRVYVEEFAAALALCGVRAEVEPVPPGTVATPAVSPFERKYLRSGQTCWRLRADLADAALPRDRAALIADIPGI